MMMASLTRAVVNFIGLVVNGLIGKLPMSPFASLPDNPALQEWGQTIGYFFPVTEIVGHTQVLLVAIGIWIALRWVFRIIRAVG